MVVDFYRILQTRPFKQLVLIVTPVGNKEKDNLPCSLVTMCAARLPITKLVPTKEHYWHVNLLLPQISRIKLQDVQPVQLTTTQMRLV